MVEAPDVARTLQDLVEGCSEQAAIVDERWTILAANDAWRNMIRVSGYRELVAGTNYRDFISAFASRGHQIGMAVMKGMDAIDEGRSDSFEMKYAGVDEWEGRTLQLRIKRLRLYDRTLAIITRMDTTALTELRRLRARFSSSVLDCQAEERRRFGRELHDSTGQLLTAAGLLLFTLSKKLKSLDAGALRVAEELRELVKEAQQEVRAVSYLTHPPSLDQMSLAHALKALAEGFARRTGLKMSFRQRGNEIRLSHADESALYRIAQEALANIQRHAKATHVCVCLRFWKSATHLIVTDDGVGTSARMIAGDGSAGVGLSGMRSRLDEIGGRFSVRRLDPGTAICASVPVR